jgi:hypothetical protein
MKAPDMAIIAGAAASIITVIVNPNEWVRLLFLFVWILGTVRFLILAYREAKENAR